MCQARPAPRLDPQLGARHDLSVTLIQRRAFADARLKLLEPGVATVIEG